MEPVSKRRTTFLCDHAICDDDDEKMSHEVGSGGTQALPIKQCVVSFGGSVILLERFRQNRRCGESVKVGIN